MREPYDPTPDQVRGKLFLPAGNPGATLPTPQFIDTAHYGVVPKIVVWPGVVPDRGPAAAPPEPARDPLAALRATIDAIAAEAAWRGPTRDLPLSQRAAGSRTVKTLNAAIEEIAARLAENPPPPREAIRLVTVPTGVLVALADLLPAVRAAERALRWLHQT